MKINFPKTVPFLPGIQFKDTLGETHHKIQQLSLINGIPQEKTNYNKEEMDPLLVDSLKMNTVPRAFRQTRQQPKNDYIPRIQAPWLKYDRQVLKFQCYFQEPVVENSIENYRIRSCALYYYLSDGTLHINEPKQENSGLMQGMFIKRQKIPKNILKANEHYTWEDLNIATNINLFQRVFRIINADAFTKEFYNYMESPLNAPEPLPADSYSTFKTLKDIKIPPPDLKEYKEYNEVKLKGGHPNGGLEQYLGNDRKVLSFSILWDDRTLEGQVNYYTLNFFLADNTVEIKEIRRHNSGKDPFPLSLNRNKLPKQPILTHYPGMTQKKEEYYGPNDIICGKFITIYGKDVFIYECDQFTKYWYQHNLGIQQTAQQIQQDQGKQVQQIVPPYNGFGSYEDSLGSVYSLMPKPPKKDVNKIYTQDQYTLRFEARLLSEAKEDNGRTFIVSFFCGDDTIQVYETSDKNSGQWQGKFLERTKHKCPKTQQFYKENNFQIGEVLQFNVYRFQLLNADQYTLNYMKSKPNIYKQHDVQQVLNRIRQGSNKFANYDEFLIACIKNIDKNNNGIVSFNEAAIGFKDLGIDLSYQEIYSLIKFFDKDGGLNLNMKYFFEGLGGARQ